MRSLAVVVVLALATPAAAASHKILVLPVDGTADTATRARLTADIARLARTLDGQVATGSATFADTALAVGCDPQAPGCSDEVIATLGVDELVWGTATRDAGRTRLVVRRAVKGGAVREVVTTLPAGDGGDRVTAAIAPLFAPPVEPAHTPPERRPATPSVTGAPGPAPSVATEPSSGTPAPPETAALPGTTRTPGTPGTQGPGEDRRDRTVGIALLAGGGLGVVLGIALWANYSSLQGEIDSHPVRTSADLEDLKALEDRASTRAIAGDVLVLAGLAAAGIGGYYLYRDHKQHAIAIAPAPLAHGAGLTITILGGL